MSARGRKRPSKRNPLDETVVEELSDAGEWIPFAPYSLWEEVDGEYTITLRVRTKRGPKRAPDKVVAKLAEELYEAHKLDPYNVDKASPYGRLLAACATRKR